MSAIDGIRLPPKPPAPTSEASAPSTASADDGPSPFAKLATALGKEVSRGEAAIKNAELAARSGRDFSTAELIALQAEVYRYNEVVDTTSKLVDHATNGVKTVLQSGGGG